MSGLDRVRKLEVWNEAVILARDVYDLSGEWPQEERYGLVSQARRAAVSISANLAEGVGSDTPREMARFGRIALGPLYELDSLSEIAGILPGLTGAGDGIRSSVVTPARRIEKFIEYHEGRGNLRLRDDVGAECVAEGHHREP